MLNLWTEQDVSNFSSREQMEEGSPVYLFNGTVIGYILIKNAPKHLTLIWKAKVEGQV